jgi:S-formylglutathione hydrolase
VPVVWFLAGLTCTEENFTVKAGAQRVAAELGLMLVAPDTSPRGEGVPDDPQGAYDFGLGAGFYVDATQEPWAKHYRMESYVARELPALIAAELPADMDRQGIMGHSMGGHGAITLALRNPGRFKAVSAFAPISSPVNCPWGEKALGGLSRARPRRLARARRLRADRGRGARARPAGGPGHGGQLPRNQLKPHLLEAACARAGVPLTLRRQEGYDHSYFFIAPSWRTICAGTRKGCAGPPEAATGRTRLAEPRARGRTSPAGWRKREGRIAGRRRPAGARRACGEDGARPSFRRGASAPASPCRSRCTPARPQPW